MQHVANTSTGNHKALPTHVILHDGHEVYTVSAAFYNDVRLKVEEILPALERHEKYTLKELCGEEFWDSLTNGEKSMAGRCMASMVVNNLLPLRFADHKHEYAKRYRLR